MRKWTERVIGAFKYLLGGIMVLSGISTLFTSTTPVSGPLGYLYSTRAGLVVFGVLVIISGGTLIYGKIRKSRRWTGRGLFWIFLILLFGTIIQFVAFVGDPSAWVGNAVFCIVTAVLWLRWKFKTEYYNPRHFVTE